MGQLEIPIHNIVFVRDHVSDFIRQNPNAVLICFAFDACFRRKPAASIKGQPGGSPEYLPTFGQKKKIQARAGLSALPLFCMSCPNIF